MSVTHRLWTAAEMPPYDRTHHGICRVCGCYGDGIPFTSWVRDTFTDHDKLRPGTIICVACQFCFDESSLLLQSKTHKDKPQRMRNYSHFVVDNAWYPLNKGEKVQMRALLPHATVAILSVSGQKHIIFRAMDGWWQFEEQSLRPNIQEWMTIQQEIDALYQGFTKEEIETGRYASHRIKEFGIAAWHQHEQAIVRKRGSLWFSFALFLAQRNDDENKSGDSDGIPSSIVERDRPGIQKQVSQEHLGTGDECTPECSVYQQSAFFL